MTCNEAFLSGKVESHRDFLQRCLVYELQQLDLEEKKLKEIIESEPLLSTKPLLAIKAKKDEVRKIAFDFGIDLEPKAESVQATSAKEPKYYESKAVGVDVKYVCTPNHEDQSTIIVHTNKERREEAVTENKANEEPKTTRIYSCTCVDFSENDAKEYDLLVCQEDLAYFVQEEEEVKSVVFKGNLLFFGDIEEYSGDLVFSPSFMKEQVDEKYVHDYVINETNEILNINCILVARKDLAYFQKFGGGFFKLTLVGKLA